MSDSYFGSLPSISGPAILVGALMVVGGIFYGGYNCGKRVQESKIQKAVAEERGRVLNVIRDDLEKKAEQQVRIAVRELDLPFTSSIQNTNSSAIFIAKEVLSSTNNYAKYNFVQALALEDYSLNLDDVITNRGKK
jgi:hypothetical protein